MREVFCVQNGWIQDGQIQDGCHHQVEWEWRSLSQIELVSIRGLFKMAESKMAEFKMAAIIKLIWLNEWSILCKWWRGKSEWSFFFWNGGNQSWWVWVSLGGKTKMAESKMASSWVRMNEWSFFVQMVGTNLGKCEWVWEEKLWWLNPTWWNSKWQNSR